MAALHEYMYRGFYLRIWKSGFTINGDSGEGFIKFGSNKNNLTPIQLAEKYVDKNYFELTLAYEQDEQYCGDINGIPTPFIRSNDETLHYIPQYRVGQEPIFYDEPETENMNHTNAAALFQEDMTTIKVVFNTSSFENVIVSDEDFTVSSGTEKEYTYKVRKSDNIKPGDYVVVPARGALQVVWVTRVDDEPDINYNSNVKYQWIVQRVNFAEYSASVDAEKKFYETLKQSEKKRIRKQMVDELVETHGEAILQSLAVKQLQNNGGE